MGEKKAAIDTSSSPLCRYHQMVMRDPALTEHDIQLLVDHGMNCKHCRLPVGDFLHTLASSK